MQRRSCHFLAARPIASLGPPLPRECRFFSPRRKAEVNYNGREKDRPFRQDQRFKSRFPPTGEILISLYWSGYTWFGSRPATNKEPAQTSRRPGLCVRIGENQALVFDDLQVDPAVGGFVALGIAHDNQVGAAGPHVQLGDRRGVGSLREPLFQKLGLGPCPKQLVARGVDEPRQDKLAVAGGGTDGHLVFS